MFTKEQQLSLELLKKLINSTPPEEIKAVIQKHSMSSIEGPTFAEYMHQLNNADFLKIGKPISNFTLEAFSSPPDMLNIITSLQDPTFVGFFFSLHLFHDTSQYSRF